MSTYREPHNLVPLRWFDRFRANGRCRACIAPGFIHPMRVWILARAYGDTSPPRRNWPKHVLSRQGAARERRT